MRSTPNLTKSNFFRLGFELRSLVRINSAFDHLTRDLQLQQIGWQLEPQVFRGFATIWQKQNKPKQSEISDLMREGPDYK